MIDTIIDLKNNRMKAGATASTVASEHTTRMKKTLGSLNAKTTKTSEPLRIGLADILNAEKKGKWWLVGASWKDDVPSPLERSDGHEQRDGVDGYDDSTTDLAQLAREQRMNTDIRRAIFVTIMSATDYQDAHNRLLKLNMKRAQELEIPKVLIRCAGCERGYNPYYALIAQKLCGEHRVRKAFQFTLWDLFKDMGEKTEGEDPNDEELDEDWSMRKMVNLGKLYGTLMAKGSLSAASLKVQTSIPHSLTSTYRV